VEGERPAYRHRLQGRRDEHERFIKERNIANKGRRIGTGTYRLSDLPDGGTRVEFEYAFVKLPALEKPLKPLMTSLLRKGNERALVRLKETLAAA
jgi:hypothetical protein